MSNLVLLDTASYEHIAIISLNRPEARNALNTQMIKQLQAVIKEIADNSSIYCAIITAEGNRAFCAGADLKERRGMNDKEVVKAVKNIGEIVLKIEEMPIPVIASMNGGAFGGGLELALGCDLRIAANDIQLGLTETSLAIIPGAGGTQRLPRLIGVARAKQLIYTAKRISAEEAKEYGIIQDIVPFEELYFTSVKLAKDIIKNGPIAIQQAKIAINHGLETDLMTGLTIEHLSYLRTLQTEDRMEALEAFTEKRNPNYHGH